MKRIPNDQTSTLQSYVQPFEKYKINLKTKVYFWSSILWNHNTLCLWSLWIVFITQAKVTYFYAITI